MGLFKESTASSTLLRKSLPTSASTKS